MMKLLITCLLCFPLYVVPIWGQCNSFAFTDYSQGKIFIMEEGKIVWEHPAPESNDLWILPNGNILFTVGKGVLEVTRQKDTVFYYSSASNIFACQRLPNGNTFVGESNSGRLLEIAPDGKIIKEVNILPSGVNDGGHAFMRNARKLANYHYLVAHYGGQLVSEYDEDGRIVWSVEVPGGPHSVIRLPDGNTLVSVADKTNDARVIELDKKGNIVWSLSNKDVSGNPFKFLGGMQYFKDGKLFVANWLGHGQEGTNAQLFLVDREKDIVCQVGQLEGVRTMSSVYCPLAEESYH